MAWSPCTDGPIEIWVDGAYACDSRSSSCPVVYDATSGRLVMFGLSAAQVKLDLEEVAGYTDIESIVSEMCAATGTRRGLNYIVSEDSASDFQFRIQVTSASGGGWTCDVKTTAIPDTATVSGANQAWRKFTYNVDGTKTVETRWDGEWDYLYKDWSVVELPDGEGWLLIAVRYRRVASSGSFNATNAGDCTSEIVGWLAPADDPTFSTTDPDDTSIDEASRITGPYHLVSSMNGVNDVLRDTGTVDTGSGTCTITEESTFRSSFGVPGVMARSEDDGIAIYLLYSTGSGGEVYDQVDTFEDGNDTGREILLERAVDLHGGHKLSYYVGPAHTDYGAPTRFTSGCGVKRILLSDLLSARDTRHFGHEDRWDLEGEPYLVTGEVYGPCHPWVDQADSIGIEDIGEDEYEHLFDLYPDATMSAPMPIVCNGTAHLFFASQSIEGHFMPGEENMEEWLPESYGVRHATALETDEARHFRFGRDWLIEAGAPRILGSDARYNYGSYSVCITFCADPEVVLLPDCRLRLYYGLSIRRSEGGDTKYATPYIETDADEICACATHLRFDLTQEVIVDVDWEGFPLPQPAGPHAIALGVWAWPASARLHTDADVGDVAAQSEDGRNQAWGG